MATVPAASVGEAAQVAVGVRPEKLKIDADDGPDSTVARALDPALNHLRGTVVDASYVGVHTEYLVRTAGGHDLTVYAQNLETSGAAEALTHGRSVSLSWRPEHSFVIADPVDPPLEVSSTAGGT